MIKKQRSRMTAAVKMERMRMGHMMGPPSIKSWIIVWVWV
jgi:hypothetical protein